MTPEQREAVIRRQEGWVPLPTVEELQRWIVQTVRPREPHADSYDVAKHVYHRLVEGKYRG